MIKIRLARGGRKKKPIYTIVAADINSPRDGKFLEKLGQYNPNAEPVLNSVNAEGISNWVKQGAILTDSVKTLLKKNKIELTL